MTEHCFGWRPPVMDNRDWPLLLMVPPTLPPAVDLRPQAPPILDQGQLGSCTANAIASAVRFERARQQLPDFPPSRLFTYWVERSYEGTTRSDAGAAIRDGFKSIAKAGVCSELTWPYNIARFTVRPPAAAFREALQHRAVAYYAVAQNLTAMKTALAAGYPFVFGIGVYASFEAYAVSQSGDVPMPSRGEALLGGHALICVGYDDSIGRFRFANSWGQGWGASGFGTIPYSYLLDPHLAADMWVCQMESG